MRVLQRLKSEIQSVEEDADFSHFNEALKHKEHEKISRNYYDSGRNDGKRIVIRKIARDMQSQYI
jgi:hypothetical protein